MGEKSLSSELIALITARDVLQAQIDARVAARRQETLLVDSFYCAGKTKRLAAYFSDRGFRIVSCVGKEQVLSETRAANFLFRIKGIALPLFKKLVAKSHQEVTFSLDELDGGSKNSLLQLCEAFEKLTWIRFEHTKHMLRIVRLNDTEATCFWHGAWAEYVNRSLVVNALREFTNSHKCPFDVFYDVKLARCEPTGNPVDMQLDLVAQLRDRFYVFDTKTGVLRIDKWVERAKIFTVDGKSRFITCCADENIPRELFRPYQLVPLSQLKQGMAQMLASDLFGQDDSVPEKGARK